MFGLILIECLSFLVIVLLLFRRIYHPIVLFSVLFFIMALFSSLGLKGLFAPSEESLKAIFWGITCFSLCCFLASAPMSRGRKKDEPSSWNGELVLERINDYPLDIRGFRVLAVIGLLSTGVHALHVLALVLRGYSFYSATSIENPFRMAYSGGYSASNTVNVFFSSIDTILYNRYVKSIMYSSCVIGTVEFCRSGGKSRRPLICAALMYLFDMITSGGARSQFFRMVICIILGLVIYRPKLKTLTKLKKLPGFGKIKRWTRIIVVLGIALIVALTVIRRNNRSFSRIALEIYQYFGYCFTFFSIKMENFRGPFAHGLVFFQSLFVIPVRIITLLGFSPPTAYQSVLNMSSDLHDWVSVGPTNMFNAYATLFYYFYVDGGMVAIILESLFYGWFCGTIYRKAENGNHAMYTAMLLFVLLGIVDSMHTYQLSGLTNVLTYLIIAYLMGKGRKLRFQVKKQSAFQITQQEQPY